MIALSSSIDIGSVNFDFVNEVEIVSSWENLTDTATIRVPKKLRIKKDGQVPAYITSADGIWKRGDAVKIQLGYDGVNEVRFEGHITRISPKLPLEFACEDQMWLLKQASIPKYSKPSVTVEQLLTDILPSGTSFECESIQLGKFKIEKATVAQVLDYLKRRMGLSAYFKDGALYVGFAYKISSLAQVTSTALPEFEFQRNIIDEGNLDYVTEDDVKYQVTAINVKKDNTRTEVTAGDPDGDQRTFHFYDVSDDELQKLADEALERVKYTGFRGSFTTFLNPMVKHGDAVKLVDPLLPDRNGVYLVREVVTRFGMSGGRQEITLDKKLE